ncbi:MAG: tetratricopeptide repeat protein [Rubrivivax sp.]|nr:tetratricopeptide repeat protein [Rubrivivax sp.]
MRWFRNSLGLALLAAGLAQAEPENITWGELALTHPVCYHTQAIPLTGWIQYERQSPLSDYWNNVLGGQGMLWAMHHYCWALIHLQRAQAAGVPAHVRKYLTEVAVSDFHYVVRHARRLPDPNQFRMLPEILYRIGDAHSKLGQIAPALEAFQQSRHSKPDYWPAYVGEADLLARSGLRKDALAILERGLVLMPGEANIAAAYKRLGGNPANMRAAKATVPPTAASAPQ